jgi:hypothetical protein
MPKHNIDVDLDLDTHLGNANNVVTRVCHELRFAGVPEDEIEQYRHDALTGDYLNITEEWVNVHTYGDDDELELFTDLDQLVVDDEGYLTLELSEDVLDLPRSV